MSKVSPVDSTSLPPLAASRPPAAPSLAASDHSLHPLHTLHPVHSLHTLHTLHPPHSDPDSDRPKSEEKIRTMQLLRRGAQHHGHGHGRGHGHELELERDDKGVGKSSSACWLGLPGLAWRVVGLGVWATSGAGCCAAGLAPRALARLRARA